MKGKALKKSVGNHIDRNAQFERIAELKESYLFSGNPIVSVDSKKKEMIGNLFREGKIYTSETVEVLDHDFPSLAEGVAVPRSIYDLERMKPMSILEPVVTPVSLPVIQLDIGGTPMENTIIPMRPQY